MAGRLKVLIVEEKVSFGKTITDVLSRQNQVEVFTFVTDAGHLVEAVTAHGPDLILADIGTMRNHRDSISKARSLRPGARIFLLAEDESAPYRRAAKKLGADKLVDKARLYDALKEILNESAHEEKSRDLEPCPGHEG